MELRVLAYFLAVAREQSIIRAAESLHLSQPTFNPWNKRLPKSHSNRGRDDSKKTCGRNFKSC